MKDRWDFGARKGVEDGKTVYAVDMGFGCLTVVFAVVVAFLLLATRF